MSAVSVLMSVYNRAHLIGRSLAKYRQQTYEDFELVIVDDGSADGLHGVATQFSDLPTRYIRLESGLRSPNIGWLTGMEAAQGDFWILTHAEIMVPRNAIQRMLEIYAEINEAKPVEHRRRVGFSCFALTEIMQRTIDEVDWQSNVDDLQGLPEFWNAKTAWGRPNCDMRSNGGLLLAFSGMDRANWDYMGRLRRTEKVGLSDQDLHLREGFLRRAARTAEGICVYHQWHNRDAQTWANLVVSPPVYQTEEQARLIEG